MADIGLNDHHQQNIISYLRFARYNRSQTLRSIQACCQDIKDSRLLEETYTSDEVMEVLQDLSEMISSEVDSELLNVSHTNTLLLRQMFSQAEKWHLKLQADISELENKELLDEIAQFEEQQFDSNPSSKTTSLLSVNKSKLEPLNEGGPTALLQVEINRLQDENKKLRERMKVLEGKAASVLDEKGKLEADLQKTRTELSSKPGSKAYSKDLADLESQMAAMKSDLKKNSAAGNAKAASIEEDLIQTKHDVLRLQHELEESRKELTKKFNETTQYKNMKQMLTSKNEQLKDLRGRLRRYEPDGDM